MKIEGSMKVKDWISNSGLHVDSLVNLKAQSKQYSLEKLNSLKILNETILPLESFYETFFGKIDGKTEYV